MMYICVSACVFNMYAVMQVLVYIVGTFAHCKYRPTKYFIKRTANETLKKKNKMTAHV